MSILALHTMRPMRRSWAHASATLAVVLLASGCASGNPAPPVEVLPTAPPPLAMPAPVQGPATGSLYSTARYRPALADPRARLVGDTIRRVHQRDAEALQQFGVEFNASFILCGQIADEPPRLFSIYAAGNFIEASSDTPYFQIGESKYGKPIVDRVVNCRTSLDEAAKCALISMDSTIRSNLSVGLPLDLLIYRRDSLKVTRHVSIDGDNPYFDMIHNQWGANLRRVFAELPDPDWATWPQEAVPRPRVRDMGETAVCEAAGKKG